MLAGVSPLLLSSLFAKTADPRLESLHQGMRQASQTRWIGGLCRDVGLFQVGGGSQ